MGEADQTVAADRSVRGVDGPADTIPVDVEEGAVEGPVLSLHAAKQRTHER